MELAVAGRCSLLEENISNPRMFCQCRFRDLKASSIRQHHL